jgi:hypothetical protein
MLCFFNKNEFCQTNPKKFQKKTNLKLFTSLPHIFPIFLFYIGPYIFTVTCGLGIKILVFTEISKQNKKIQKQSSHFKNTSVHNSQVYKK